MLYTEDKITLAYIVGVALGDGNLSNPNGRAVRLRITCDLKYPNLIETIKQNLRIISPINKVGVVSKKNCNAIDIYCYSNQWPEVLGWKVGDKAKQNVRVPAWIREEQKYSIACLRGLIQTDGSIYIDRKYKMVNYVCCINSLAQDAVDMIESIGFKPTVSVFKHPRYRTKYTIRISKNTTAFIEKIALIKD